MSAFEASSVYALQQCVLEPRAEDEALHAWQSVLGADAPVKVLFTDQVLFRSGDPRVHLYRVEAGAVCVTREIENGAREVIELALPGDLVGFGSRDSHMWTAEAIGETRVRCLPANSDIMIAAMDSRVRSRRDRAIERELAAVRDALAAAGRRNPQARLAAFFVALSRQNEDEGRSRNEIVEQLKCGTVASYLGLSIDELSATLRTLEARGVIARSEDGSLRLTDTRELARIAEE